MNKPKKVTGKPLTSKTSDGSRKKTATSMPSKGFDVPQVNSTKQILDKMERVENLSKNKCPSSLENKQKLTADEEITRLVNFPLERVLYKGLIPLCTKSAQPSVQTSRDPLPLKDVEPNLEDFFKPEVLPEYRYQVSLPRNQHKSVKEYSGLKLTKIINNWE